MANRDKPVNLTAPTRIQLTPDWENTHNTRHGFSVVLRAPFTNLSQLIVDTHRLLMRAPLILSLALILSPACSATELPSPGPTAINLETLGEQLFLDRDLSRYRTQSCATCHVPEAGFSDPRDNLVAGAVSLGDDGQSLGVRNAPTASYASFTPPFQQDARGKYRGGLFLDGRATDLQAQAAEPFLNPVEMAMPSKASVVARLQEKPAYVAAFKQLFGHDIFADTDTAYAAITESLAAFERTPAFSPFDSKYDRYLRGEYKFSDQEQLGMTLFFSQQFTNCNLCHQLNRLQGSEGETFSNYEYHNIGVPVNSHLQSTGDKRHLQIDTGLFQNPKVSEQSAKGKFKVPSLRNVAVTGPYMHNGVFQDLRTVVLFYNKFNSRSAKRQINPETGERWRTPEVADNISIKELETGPALDDKRVNALVAFLKTLTDQRYQHLLGQQ